MDGPDTVVSMDYVRFALVVINTLAFLALVIMSVRFGRREKYAWVRRLWTIVAIACGALLVGSIQRLALQAVSLGWLPESASELITGDLQLVQSAVVLALIVGVFVILNRLTDAIETSERVSASLLERVRHVDPKHLHLTNRESEVLAFIGQGVTTDSELAAELHVSPSTVQSHVKSLLRKAELHSRMDLIALAILVGSIGSSDQSR